MPAWGSPNACALLEFTEAPTHILRVFHSVDIGITTITCTSHLGHSCFVLELVAGSEQYPDAYTGQHHNRSDPGQPTIVS